MKNGFKVKLGKDFVSILVLQSVEIYVMFCQAKADNVIDVLARAPDLNSIAQEHIARTLANVHKQIIHALVRVCAQPKGIQMGYIDRARHPA
jgi:hypothetical protein